MILFIDTAGHNTTLAHATAFIGCIQCEGFMTIIVGCQRVTGIAQHFTALRTTVSNRVPIGDSIWRPLAEFDVILIQRQAIIALTDGEIFSNLKFTQWLYDALKQENAITPPDPIDPGKAITAAGHLVETLINADGVALNQLLMGEALAALTQDLIKTTAQEDGAKGLLQAAFTSSQAYHEAWLAKIKGKK